MADEGFLRRWSRRKSQSARGDAPPPEPEAGLAPGPVVANAHAAHAANAANPAHAVAATAATSAATPTMPTTLGRAGPVGQTGAAPAAARALPTLDDVAQLTPDADFSAFVARDVDPAVRRGALRKLFADPHFNAIDRLDVYMDDYTKPSPMSAAMLASLAHARSVFWRPDAQEATSAAAPDHAAMQAVPVPDAALAQPVTAASADAPAAEPEPSPESRLEEATAMTTTTTPENETP